MKPPLIGIIMGSDSDLPTMQDAIAVCEEFGVKVCVVSATPLSGWWNMLRTPWRGIKVIIAGAGAPISPVVASTRFPLVPVPSRHLQGLDSLYSIVQMPAGIPVATVAIGNAKKRWLLAVQILATHQPNY